MPKSRDCCAVCMSAVAEKTVEVVGIEAGAKKT
jgi:hypothetical protein